MDRDVEPDTLPAPGWKAIDRALAPLYADQTPKHYVIFSFGDPADWIRGISAYKRVDPVPHWHFVTYGFTELFRKASSDAEVSGYGFELTMRVRSDPAAEEPPSWVLDVLQDLAGYVFQTGNVFTEGDYVNANGPIVADADTLIRSLVVAYDPELPPIETPNGRVEFLQVVGITDDEELAIKHWSAPKVIEVFKEHLPLLVTDLDRASLLDRSDVREKLSAGAAAEGSSTAHVFVDQLSWEEKKRLLRTPEIHVTLGARQVQDIRGLLAHRLPFGREFALIGGEFKVVFVPGGENRHAVDGSTLRVEIRPDTLTEIQSVLDPQESIYPLSTFKGMVVHVKKTHIHDQDGKVVETIG